MSDPGQIPAFIEQINKEKVEEEKKEDLVML